MSRGRLQDLEGTQPLNGRAAAGEARSTVSADSATEFMDLPSIAHSADDVARDETQQAIRELLQEQPAFSDAFVPAAVSVKAMLDSSTPIERSSLRTPTAATAASGRARTQRTESVLSATAMSPTRTASRMHRAGDGDVMAAATTRPKSADRFSFGVGGGAAQHSGASSNVGSAPSLRTSVVPAGVSAAASQRLASLRPLSAGNERLSQTWAGAHRGVVQPAQEALEEPVHADELRRRAKMAR